MSASVQMNFVEASVRAALSNQTAEDEKELTIFDKQMMKGANESTADDQEMDDVPLPDTQTKELALDKQIKDLETVAERSRAEGDHLTAYHADKAIQDIKSSREKPNFVERHSEAAQKYLNAATGAANGVRTLTQGGGSGLENAIGVCDLIGGVLQAIPGPYAPLAGAAMSLLGACLGFGLKQGPSLAEQIKGMIDGLKEYIKTSFEEYKDDDIVEVFTTASRKYEASVVFLEALITQEDIRNFIHNGMDAKEMETFLDEKKPQQLSQAELPQLTSVHYREFGLDILGKLQAQIERHKNSDSDNKKKHVAKYVYYYVEVAIWRRFILNLQCVLLSVNELHVTRVAQQKTIAQNTQYDKVFLQQFIRPEDKFTLQYLSQYRGISQEDAVFINKYMALIGVGGQIPCYGTIGAHRIRKMAIRSCRGTYLSMPLNNTGAPNSTAKTILGPCEQWEPILVNTDRSRPSTIALRNVAFTNVYLQRNGDGKLGRVNHPEMRDGPVCFEVFGLPGWGWYAFKCQGKFLSAQQDGRILCDRDQIAEWEKFTLEILELK